jgi:hypothetical protein
MDEKSDHNQQSIIKMHSQNITSSLYSLFLKKYFSLRDHELFTDYHFLGSYTTLQIKLFGWNLHLKILWLSLLQESRFVFLVFLVFLHHLVYK